MNQLFLHRLHSQMRQLATALATLLFGLYLFAPPAHAIDETLPGYITYTAEDTVYVEIIGIHHLKPGDIGILKRRGREVAYVRVTEPGQRYINFQVIALAPGVELATGDSIVFETRIPRKAKSPAKGSNKWQALDKIVLGGALDENTTYQVSAPWEKLPEESGEISSTPRPDMTLMSSPTPEGPLPDLTPIPLSPKSATTPAISATPPETVAVQPIPEKLPEAPAPAEGQAKSTSASTLKSDSPAVSTIAVLSPVAVAAKTKAGNSREKNIFHGRLRLREVYQSVPALSMATSQSRADSDGSLERIYGSAWSAVWNGNLTYRDGNTFSSAPDFRHPKAHVYTAMLSRKLQDGGAFKAGRFLPIEIPGLGFLDGSQLDHVFSPTWRAGGLLAFRPDRIDLSLTSKEPLAVGYMTTEQGTHGQLYYSGTVAMLQSMYRGEADELSLLYDHRMDVGPKLNLFATSQLNFDVGGARVHTGPRLTRLDFYGNSPLFSSLSLRAGLSHYERADIAAERDLSGGSLSGFDDGFWRYFVGSNQRLPWNFTTDEEISYIDSTSQPNDALWRFSISHNGFFWLHNLYLSASAYNVVSTQGKGVAFQGTASTPLWTDKLNLYLASSAQYSSIDPGPKQLNVNDASARINWRISRAWNFDAGVTQTYQSNITSTIGDGSLSYRW